MNVERKLGNRIKAAKTKAANAAEAQRKAWIEATAAWETWEAATTDKGKASAWSAWANAKAKAARAVANANAAWVSWEMAARESREAAQYRLPGDD